MLNYRGASESWKAVKTPGTANAKTRIYKYTFSTRDNSVQYAANAGAK